MTAGSLIPTGTAVTSLKNSVQEDLKNLVRGGLKNSVQGGFTAPAVLSPAMTTVLFLPGPSFKITPDSL
jgi:hypothetical protein